MKNIIITVLFCVSSVLTIYGQTIKFEGKEFEIANVKASVVQLNGEEVLKVERDLEKISFDMNRLEATVDEPTFVKLKGVDIENGVIEVKVLARIQNPSPFPGAQGFIGLAFRIKKDNSAFESIYFRPNVGRSENQMARNHTVQYFAYPDYKFERLRKPEYRGQYETYADVGLNEWITMRIEIIEKKAKLYVNNQQHASFIVGEMLSSSKSGSIGLWVDIGTEGYFKELTYKKK